jgi:selenide,water dikinase
MNTASPTAAPDRRRHLVLVGGGHSHVQVLRRFVMQPPPLRVTLVVDDPVAIYSGMVPGFVAGQYAAAELEIDVVPLARRAGAEVVLAPATGVDPAARTIAIADRAPLAYDLASFDIGSTVVGLDLPGVRELAVPTRPIARLVRETEALVSRVTGLPGPPRVVVVGGGAGGVELAFTLEARLRRDGATPRVTLVHAGERLLEGFARGLGERATRHAAAREIEVRLDTRVVSATAGRVLLEDGTELACDALVWVAGATSHGLFRGSGLGTDRRGFARVRRTLQVEGHDTLFAVGDCATLVDHPETAKAGVYAVRQGPYLTHNLLAAAAGRPLREYRPQRDFLTLLNLGDGVALGAKWGCSFEGRWAMRLKDRIDRSFMRRFQVLDAAGAELEEFAAMPEMPGAASMLCGGCASKLGQEPLARALARLDLPRDAPAVVFGVAAAEDVVAYGVGPDAVVVSSVDAFRPFSEDAHLVGRVAAVNAASDLLAKGVSPRFAQALVAVPDSADDARREEMLFQFLSGARQAFDELGVTLLGGHTTTAPAPLVGFVVEGTSSRGALVAKAGARSGDALVLTKPLGTGVLLHADMRGRARGSWLAAVHRAMLTTNAAAAAVAVELEASAATDVTGFGLGGHLADLLRAAGGGGVVRLSSLPALPGALELLARGERSTFHPENRRGLRGLEVVPEARTDPRLELLFDPQTSGGLLIALAPERAAELVARVEAATGLAAAVVGSVGPPGAAAFRVEA